MRTKADEHFWIWSKMWNLFSTGCMAFITVPPWNVYQRIRRKWIFLWWKAYLKVNLGLLSRQLMYYNWDKKRPQCLCAQLTLYFDHMWMWLCKEPRAWHLRNWLPQVLLQALLSLNLPHQQHPLLVMHRVLVGKLLGCELKLFLSNSFWVRHSYLKRSIFGSISIEHFLAIQAGSTGIGWFGTAMGFDFQGTRWKICIWRTRLVASQGIKFAANFECTWRICC